MTGLDKPQPWCPKKTIQGLPSNNFDTINTQNDLCHNKIAGFDLPVCWSIGS